MQRVEQSTDLLRFMSTLKVGLDGDIILNVLDTEENFVSRFYTPRLEASTLSTKILEKIRLHEIAETSRGLRNDTLPILIMNSDLRLENPYMYKLAQSIVLDCFSVVYAIENNRELLKETDMKSLLRTRININYLIDFLGDQDKYTAIVDNLQGLGVAVGYLENQLPILWGETNG